MNKMPEYFQLRNRACDAPFPEFPHGGAGAHCEDIAESRHPGMWDFITPFSEN